MTIPKIIWSYWDSFDIPPLVNLCIQNWKRYCPNYTIRVLNKSHLPEGFYELDPPRASDWIRLNVIKRYGGIWLDASIFLTQSLDWVTEPTLFFTSNQTVDPMYPMIESWFIAAPPNNKIITSWFEEFHGACVKYKNDGESYAKTVPKECLRGIHTRSYFTVYICLQKIIRKQKLNFRLIDSLRTAYYYHTLHKGVFFSNQETIVESLTSPDYPIIPPLIKITNSQRPLLNPICASADSIMGRFLLKPNDV